MAVERTFSIIKPDAVAKNAIGRIVARFEAAGLKIIAARMMQLSQAQAEGFYAVHRERPFFGDLVNYMVSGPVFLVALEGEGGPLRLREVVGATDPAQAAEGTVRKRFGIDKGRNSVHASDSETSAARETTFFFPNEM